MRPIACCILVAALASIVLGVRNSAPKRPFGIPRGPQIGNVIAAVLTPTNADGSLNVTLVPGLAASLKKQGVKSVFVSGTSGQSLSFSVDERKALIAAWCNMSYEFYIIINVAAESVADSQALATYAQANSANAIAAYPTVYNQAADIQVLESEMAAIMNAAPRTPFFYYHIPTRSHTTFRLIDIVTALAAQPQFTGVKFSDGDTLQLQEAMRFTYQHQSFSFFSGQDENILGFRSLGVDGVIGGTYNFIGDMAEALISAVDNGNTEQAAALQFNITTLISGGVQWGIQNPGSDWLTAIQNSFAFAPVGPGRLPLVAPNEAGAASAKQLVTQFCDGGLVLKPIVCY